MVVRTDAVDPVTTIRLTFVLVVYQFSIIPEARGTHPYFRALSRTPTVPWIAGMVSSDLDK